MTDNMKQFYEKVSKDEALKAELEAAFKDAQESEQTSSIIEFAKQKGCILTQEDFADMDEDLNLEELEGVTGAGVCVCYDKGIGSGSHIFCVCTHTGEGFHPMYKKGKFCTCSRSGFGTDD